EKGARVGDLFMSLIYTCQLNQANPFDYLTQLQRHADQLAAGPQLWMPWNYRETLASKSGAQQRGNVSEIEAMSQRKPKKATPANKQPELMAQLRRALSRRKKAELVDILLAGIIHSRSLGGQGLEEVEVGQGNHLSVQGKLRLFEYDRGKISDEHQGDAS